MAGNKERLVPKVRGCLCFASGVLLKKAGSTPLGELSGVWREHRACAQRGIKISSQSDFYVDKPPVGYSESNRQE